MRIYKCDRCGEQFADSGPMDPPTSPAIGAEKTGLTTKVPFLLEKRIVVAEADLCGKCVKELAIWMSYLRK